VGTALSFPIILLVMVGVLRVMENRPPPVRRVYAPSIMSPLREGPSPAPPARSAVGPGTEDRTSVGRSEVGSAETDRAGNLELDPRIGSELEELKQEWQQQIDALAEYRDAQIAALARRLAQLPPSEAVEAVADLDDELVARAFARMRSEQREALLDRFPRARARRIRKWLRPLLQAGRTRSEGR